MTNERLRKFNIWRLLLLLPMLWLSISTAGPHEHDFFPSPIVAAAFDAPVRADADAAFSESPAHDEHCLACEWAAASTAIVVAVAAEAPTFATCAARCEFAPFRARRTSLVPASRGPPSEILDSHFQNFRRTQYNAKIFNAAPMRGALSHSSNFSSSWR